MSHKPVICLGSSRGDLRRFPDDARTRAGFELYRIQQGLEPRDWKPMPTVGRGAAEIRVRVGREFPRRKAVVTRARRYNNAFEAAGFAPKEAEHLRVRADLMLALERLVTARKLTQAAAAKLLHVSQPRISDLMRGKIERFSIDTLVEMLGRAGADVSVSVRRRTRAA